MIIILMIEMSAPLDKRLSRVEERQAIRRPAGAPARSLALMSDDIFIENCATEHENSLVLMRQNSATTKQLVAGIARHPYTVSDQRRSQCRERTVE